MSIHTGFGLVHLLSTVDAQKMLDGYWKELRKKQFGKSSWVGWLWRKVQSTSYITMRKYHAYAIYWAQEEQELTKMLIC